MYSCPHCGGPIRANAKSCPHCGSDEQTGWSDQTYLDGIDEIDEVDYDELLKQEFPHHAPKRIKLSWKVITGSIVLLLFIAAMLKIML